MDASSLLVYSKLSINTFEKSTKGIRSRCTSATPVRSASSLVGPSSAGSAAAQWIVAGYSLAFALLLMAGGRLGDSFGYRRVFIVGVTGFTLASAGCGLAANGGQLVAARLLQGATGAIMAPHCPMR